MINFLITFLLLLLSGSIFILGFFTITRGKIIILPNGKEEKEKEIFGEWQLFWEDIVRYQKVFYEGEQLEFKLKILEQLKPAYINEISFSTKDKKSLFFNTPPTDAEIRDIEFSLNCKVFKNSEVIFLYENEPVYKFSEWVRKITNCYICLSSCGGTFYYWIFMYFYSAIFNQATHPTLCKTIFWIIYCVSLSFLNKTLKEFFDKENK